MPLDRRDFLRTAGAAATAVLTAPAFARPAAHRRVILLLLTGGPSHLDTFDPKPAAPSEVRGPFRPIRTTVPGLHLSELLPLTAARAHRLAVIRSLHHDEAPIHETGLQLLQTGRLSRGNHEAPHFGAAVTRLTGAPWALVPGPLGDTGVDVSHGQAAGPLGIACEPLPGCLSAAGGESDGVAGRYGPTEFGRHCLLARRLIETTARCVTVNMFSTVYHTLSWDCHADGGLLPTTLTDYRDTVCPTFDRAFSALLDDLSDRGLLDTTLVLAVGEFGRTPYLNSRGGRDHWPGAWSALLAGGGVRGGQVIGATDALGGEPKDRPVTPAELTATVYHALGIDPRTPIPGPDGRAVPLVEAEPVGELF
jgi:uncharacterized protein (DUF1501 family)